jgi:two-component system response regulator NreC
MAYHVHLAVAPNAASARPARERPIRVVLADDHALMRRSMRLLLDSADGIDVVAEAGDQTSLNHHVSRQSPDVLVIDLRLPDGSTMEAVQRLRDRAPGTEIVVVTMEDDPGFAQQALDAGAIGFVLKHMADVELLEAVRAAAVGQEFVSSHLSVGLAALRHAVLSA